MKIKLPAREDVAVDMAPMIDLVFLLLIFFMVASVVKELDKKEVDIPASSHAKVPDNAKGRMMLSVDADNHVYIGMKPVSMEELKTEIETELELDPNVRILIRADRRVEYGTCRKIMMACGEVGAIDIIYAAYEE